MLVGAVAPGKFHADPACPQVVEGNRSPDRSTLFGHVHATVSAALATPLLPGLAGGLAHAADRSTRDGAGINCPPGVSASVLSGDTAIGQRLMPMDSEESGLPAPLAHRVGRDANATQIADAVVATWQDIDTALAPILGSRGVAALYKRSLHLCGATHPWLAALHEGVRTSVDLAPLRSLCARQGGADAVNAANDLFRTFYQLLSSLIGPSLTERLLRSVWSDSSGGPPAQDTSP